MSTFRLIRRFLFILISVFIILLILLDKYVSPITNRVSLNHAKLIAYNSINNSINEAMSKIDAGYEDMTTVTYDSDRNVKSIETNSAEINRIKTELVKKVSEDISQYEITSVGVPIGTLTGNDFLSGLGPEIDVSVQYGGCVVTDVISEFISAGINQTLHRIVVNVSVDIYIISFGKNLSDTVDCECCIAETIIVGNIPDTYIDVNKNNS